MANRTVKDAVCVKGTNPQYLIEKIIRTRIYESKFWKEECFALSAELLVDKAMELKFVGGVYGGNTKVSPFLCLILKMLQIQPEKDIVVEFITQTDYKYVRALGAMYMRLTGTSIDCYKYLEPLYCDYSKLKRQRRDGNFEIVHMDDFVDELLREERALDIILPRIQKRVVLEQTNQLESRVMVDADLELSDEEIENKDVEDRNASNRDQRGERRRSRTPLNERSRSRTPKRRRSDYRSRSRERERDREKRREADRGRDREKRRDRDHEKEKDRNHKDRHRSRSRERKHKRDDGKKERERDREDHHRARKNR